MADPVDPQAVINRIAKLEHAMDELVDELKRLNGEAAEAKKAAEVAFARGYLEAGGPVEERKQQALIAAADARFAADLADRKVAGCKEALRAIHAHLDAARTIASTVRAEAALARTGYTP